VIQSVLVVDDEPLARTRIRDCLAQVAPEVAVRSAGDGNAAVAALREQSVQAVFLDVQMPGRSGFDVIDTVGVDRMPPVVMVTAYDRYALRAFDLAAVDYLLKPFDVERFAAAWHRVERAHAHGVLADEAQRLQALLDAVRGASGKIEASGPQLERFLVRIGERTEIVAVKDVRWMQSDGNYVDLHTPHGVRTVRETLATLEERLDPTRYVRIHRRVIVAIDYIKELLPWLGGDQVLVLKDGTRLRVSRTRREAVGARLRGVATR
jgi:two-component system, LytTR family, response regulator